MKKAIILLFIGVCFLSAGTVSAFDGLNEVEIHGFVSQGYMQSTDYNYSGLKTKDGSFEFNEMGINFSTSPTESLRIGAQLFARDYGELGNDGIEVDWAYGDYRVNNHLGIRAGKVKIALGLYNEVRDIDAVRTAVVLPNAIYVEQNRDVYAGIKGVGIYGELPGGFSYQAAYGVGMVSDESNLLRDLTTILNDRLQTGYFAVGGSTAADLVSVGDPTSVNTHNTQNAQLQWAPRFVEGLRLCGSWLFTEIDMSVDVTTPVFNFATMSWEAGPLNREEITVEHLSSVVGSIEYIFGETVLSAEYNIIRVDIDQFQGLDVPTTEVHGWAVSASHRFTEWFELGAYYSDWNTNVRDRDGKDFEELLGNRHREERWLRDTCLTFRFDLNENWIFKTEGHYMSGLDDVDFGDDPNPDPHWFLFAGKISYNF